MPEVLRKIRKSSGVLPTIFNAFFAALRYTRFVVAAYALPSKAANSLNGFILMSLYSVYFFAGKPGTAGEGLKRSTKDLKLAIYRVLQHLRAGATTSKMSPGTALEWLPF